MKNKENKVTNIFQKIFISLPFLPSTANRYEKLVWTAQAIHILTKNGFVFNVENQEDIDTLDDLLSLFFKSKNLDKIELNTSEDKRQIHYLKHNNINDFVIKIKGLISNFIPYIQLAIEYDSFKKQRKYIDIFQGYLSKEETENQYELSLFQEVDDDPIIQNIIEYIYIERAKNYFKYQTIIENNLIKTKKIDIKNDTEFDLYKLNYVKYCINKNNIRDARIIISSGADDVLDTRMQRLTIKQLTSEYFLLKRVDFKQYFDVVKRFFLQNRLLHPDFYEQNAFFFIKFLSGAKARYYISHKHHMPKGTDYYNNDIVFHNEVQPQILLIGSSSQGSGKSKFVELFFTNYIKRHIEPSLDITRGAGNLNALDSRQQDIFFKNQKGNLFTYLGDVKKFNMDVLKDIMDRKQVTYNIMRSDKSCTHNIALNFIMTMNDNFHNSTLLKRIQTSDLGKQRRLLFLISSEKNLTDKENQRQKLKFDKLSQTPKFKADVDYIMTHCPMGWDWMIDTSQDRYIPLVEKYNEIEVKLQEKQSPKQQYLEDVRELFDFFEMQYVPFQCLFQIFKEKYNQNENSKSFASFLNGLGIEQKRVRGSSVKDGIPIKAITFKGKEYSLKEFIEAHINMNSTVRCRENPFYNPHQKKDLPF